MQSNTLQAKTERITSMRVGRGGKRGKTSGRGTKGQNARAGHRKRPEMRDIIKGDTYEDLIIIKKGLNEGEIVVLEGQINLTNGSTIAVKKETPTTLESQTNEGGE